MSPPGLQPAQKMQDTLSTKSCTHKKVLQLANMMFLVASLNCWSQARMYMFKGMCTHILHHQAHTPLSRSVWPWMQKHKGILLGIGTVWIMHKADRFWKSISFSVPIIVSRGTTGEPEFPQDGTVNLFSQCWQMLISNYPFVSVPKGFCHSSFCISLCMIYSNLKVESKQFCWNKPQRQKL